MTDSQPDDDREFVEALRQEIVEACEGDEAQAIDLMASLVALFQTATAISQAALTSRRGR